MLEKFKEEIRKVTINNVELTMRQQFWNITFDLDDIGVTSIYQRYFITVDSVFDQIF